MRRTAAAAAAAREPAEVGRHRTAPTVPVLLVLLAVALYWPLRGVPLVADDYPNLLHPWNFVAAASPLFRPLEAALVALQADAFARDATAYHAVSLALFAGCVLAVHALALRCSPGVRAPGGAARSPRLVAAAAALVFLIDPRAVQTVVWSSAVGNLAYSLAVLGAVLAWPRHPWLTAALYLVALGAKEAAIVLPALLCLLPHEEGVPCGGLAPGERLWRRLWARRARLAPVLLVGAAFGAFEAARPEVLRVLGDRAPFIWAVTGGYHLVGGRLLLRNLVSYPALVFLPWLNQDRLLATHRWWWLAPADAGFLAWWWRAGGLRRLGALWILLAAAPAALFAPFDISDLYLFLPAVGLSLGAGELAAGLAAPRARRLAGTAAAMLIAALLAAEGAALVRTEAAWRRDGTRFARERAVLVATARARPDATIVAEGLPARDGEVYLWMDAAPYVLAWLVPRFHGRLVLDAPPAPGAVVLVFDPATGRLAASAGGGAGGHAASVPSLSGG